MNDIVFIIFICLIAVVAIAAAKAFYVFLNRRRPTWWVFISEQFIVQNAAKRSLELVSLVQYDRSFMVAGHALYAERKWTIWERISRTMTQ